MAAVFQPHEIESWFPSKYRQRYVERIIGLSGLTPTQANYFVRLWGYGYLKQYSSEQTPIKTLSRNIQPFRCSHKEAANLFYGKEQKSPRSAGDMIDTFVKKGFALRESFRGTANKTRITLINLEKVDFPDDKKNRRDHSEAKIYIADFDIRNDKKEVAYFVKKLFSFACDFPESAQRNIESGLRNWAERYPQGMRVMRCAHDKDIDDGRAEQTIGFVAVFQCILIQKKCFIYRLKTASI